MIVVCHGAPVVVGRPEGGRRAGRCLVNCRAPEPYFRVHEHVGVAGRPSVQSAKHFFLAIALYAEVRGGLDLPGAIDAPDWHNDGFPGSFFPRGTRAPGSVTVEERMGPVIVEEPPRP